MGRCTLGAPGEAQGHWGWGQWVGAEAKARRSLGLTRSATWFVFLRTFPWSSTQVPWRVFAGGRTPHLTCTLTLNIRITGVCLW